jgi:hypothetical protein
MSYSRLLHEADKILRALERKWQESGDKDDARAFVKAAERQRKTNSKSYLDARGALKPKRTKGYYLLSNHTQNLLTVRGPYKTKGEVHRRWNVGNVDAAIKQGPWVDPGSPMSDYGKLAELARNWAMRNNFGMSHSPLEVEIENPQGALLHRMPPRRGYSQSRYPGTGLPEAIQDILSGVPASYLIESDARIRKLEKELLAQRVAPKGRAITPEEFEDARGDLGKMMRNANLLFDAGAFHDIPELLPLYAAYERSGEPLGGPFEKPLRYMAKRRAVRDGKAMLKTLRKKSKLTNKAIVAKIHETHPTHGTREIAHVVRHLGRGSTIYPEVLQYLRPFLKEHNVRVPYSVFEASGRTGYEDVRHFFPGLPPRKEFYESLDHQIQDILSGEPVDQVVGDLLESLKPKTRTKANLSSESRNKRNWWVGILTDSKPDVEVYGPFDKKAATEKHAKLSRNFIAVLFQAPNKRTALHTARMLLREY